MSTSRDINDLNSNASSTQPVKQTRKRKYAYKEYTKPIISKGRERRLISNRQTIEGQYLPFKT